MEEILRRQWVGDNFWCQTSLLNGRISSPPPHPPSSSTLYSSMTAVPSSDLRHCSLQYCYQPAPWSCKVPARLSPPSASAAYSPICFLREITRSNKACLGKGWHWVSPCSAEDSTQLLHLALFAFILFLPLLFLGYITCCVAAKCTVRA